MIPIPDTGNNVTDEAWVYAAGALEKLRDQVVNVNKGLVKLFQEIGTTTRSMGEYLPDIEATDDDEAFGVSFEMIQEVYIWNAEALGFMVSALSNLNNACDNLRVKLYEKEDSLS